MTADYTYDGLERMAIRTTANMSPAGTTHYLYDLQGHLLVEADDSGTTLREYVWLGDTPLALVTDVNTANPHLYYIHADQVNRPLRMTDASQAVVWDAIYRPFGDSVSITGPAANNLRFPGQYFLIEDGLHYNWYRHYDQTLGRYVQADPLGFVGGPSGYAYAESAPSVRVDMFGLTSLIYDTGAGTLFVDPEMSGRSPYTIPASSGRPNCSCSPSDKNRGPIPPGAYSLFVNQLSNPGRIGDILRNLRGDWGDWRVPLIPDPQTNTYGRSGFFLHGGAFPGSAGCIDVGGGWFGNAQTEQLVNDILSDADKIVPVTVR